MPDENCRKCGGELLEHTICAKCRVSNQFICQICGSITLQQNHTKCFHKLRTFEPLQIGSMC